VVLLWLQRASPEAVLTELRVLARVVADLGQLPVFMTQLGAAVKQQRARYPLYALFRPVHLPRDVHNYLYRGRRASNVDQLQRHLVSCRAAGDGRPTLNTVLLA
jgi:hypothetical protein